MNYDRTGFLTLVGRSKKINHIKGLIRSIAPLDSTVLITGENGTGKELIAREIHHLSQRRPERFVAVNCGAIPDNLVENELFGHEKGAFTGADQSQDGKFVLADRGTIFLDEVGELSLQAQVKLLRVIQEQEVVPIGSRSSIQINVRIIAATNRNMDEAVHKREFREDLFYRLNVIPIVMPALRERKDDIGPLIEYFIAKFNQKFSRHIDGITATANQCLLNYHWPGNIRELENLIERIAVLKGRGVIDVDDLPSTIQAARRIVLPDTASQSVLPEDGLDLNRALRDFEVQMILHALERTGWNKNRAANLLKIKRTTLIEKIKKHNLTPDVPDQTMQQHG